MSRVDAKWYLITGATGGVGKAISRVLAQKGFNIVLIATNSKNLNELADKLETESLCYSKDITSTQSISDIFCDLRQRGIRLNGFVHCAGLTLKSSISQHDDKEAKNLFNVNYFSFLEIMRYFSSEEFSFNGSCVVGISSIASQKGGNMQSAYSASKAALDITVKCMSRELLARNIRINTVQCGGIATPMLDSLRAMSKNFDENFAYTQPLGIIPPESVAKIICFLLFDESKYITGQAIPFDAGSYIF